MPNKKPKRDPLATAPTSQEIMSGARRRSLGQHPIIPSSQLTGLPSRQRHTKPSRESDNNQDRPKATFYLPPTLLKALKRYAVESEETQSQIVQSAIQEYLEKHPVLPK